MGKKKKQSPPSEAPNTLLSLSHVKILDLLGEGQISGFVTKSGIYGTDPLVSTYYDDVPVRNLDGSYNFNVSGGGFSFGYTLGTPTQTPIDGFERIENLVPLTSNTRLSNPIPGEGEYKQVVASFNTDIYPDANAIKLSVRIPALQQQDSKGNIDGYELKYAVDISINNGPFVLQQEITINGKCNSPYVKDSTHILPKKTPALSYYEWKVRVRRTTQTIVSSKVANDILIESIAVISNAKFSYPNSVLVGTKIDFSQFSSVPVRAYEIDGALVSVPSGYQPTFYSGNGGIAQASYPGIWNGVFDSQKKWTNNPAWILYDLLTNKRYGLGSYISQNSIDKWTLYEIAQYCDDLVSDGEGGFEPRFTCNIVISDRREAYDLLLSLSSVFRGMLYWSNGRIISNQNLPKNSLFNFTNANVVEGAFTYSDTAGYVRSTVVTVKYTNPNNLYKEDVVLIEDQESISRYGYVNKEITAFACSSKAQAYRVGKWTLQTERLTTETITFQAGLESNYLRPGDVFSVFDNYRNNSLQGGRIIGFNSGKNIVTLDKPVNLFAGNNYSLSVAAPNFNISSTGEITSSTGIPFIRNSQIENRLVLTSGVSGVNQIAVTSGFSNATFEGGVWILSQSGESASIFNKSTQYQCLALAEINQGTLEILGLEYNTGIYDFSEYSLSGYPLNSGDNSPILPPTNFQISTVTGLIEDGTFISYFDLGWNPSPSDNLAYYSLSGKTFDEDWSLLSQDSSTGYGYNIQGTGFYSFNVHAVSWGGLSSTSITGGFLVPGTNPLGGPPPLSYIFVTGDYNTKYLGTGFTGYYGNSPTIAWNQVTASDGTEDPRDQFLSGYKIYLQDPLTSATFHGPIETFDNFYQVPENVLNTGSNRLFKAYVEVLDTFGGILSGGFSRFNNPIARPPQSGFNQVANSLQYIFTTNELDITGINLWVNISNSFAPNFTNVSYTNTSLSSFYTSNIYQDYYLWYSLQDSFARNDATIYGPVLITPQNSNRSPFNLGFFLENQPDETGIAIGELISSRGFIFTGYGVSCRTVGDSTLSGNLYYCDLDNSNRSDLGKFGLNAGQNNRLQSLFNVDIPNMKKLGYDVTSIGNNMEKMALSLFGYEVK